MYQLICGLITASTLIMAIYLVMVTIYEILFDER